MRKSFITLILLFALSSVAVAETKIATVDMIKLIESILAESDAAKALSNEREELKTNLLAKKASIEKLEQELKEKGVSPDSSEADAFRQKAKDYQREVSDAEAALGTKRARIQKSALDKVNTAVKLIAMEKNISVVLNKSDAAPGAVLFSNDQMDLTEEVQKKLK